MNETDRKEAEKNDAEKAAERVEGLSLGSMWGADRRSITEAWQRFTRDMAAQPALALQAHMRYQAELASIWFGDSGIELPADSRFEDPAWRDNPVFKRVWQSYVAWSRALDEWLDKSGLAGIDRQRAQFLLDAAKDIFAPVNSPFAPEAIRKAAQSNGASMVKGIQQFFDDLRNNHGYPAVADRNAFELGRDVAAKVQGQQVAQKAGVGFEADVDEETREVDSRHLAGDRVCDRHAHHF